MIKRIEYPHLPDGTASPQLRNELRKLVDNINEALTEVERLFEKAQGGNASGG